jgi:hypothetical protein
MKHLKLIALSFLALFALAPVATGIAAFATEIGMNPNVTVMIVLPLLFVASLFGYKNKKNNYTANGMVMEVWAKYIMERFFKDNSFLSMAYDDSDYVLQGRIVHIPQPGSKPVVQVNRSVFPATAVRRTDTDILYSLDEYTTDPTHIPNIDAINLSYNKQDSVLGDHMAVLTETVADVMLLKWAADATTVHTTGGSTAATVGPVGAQTGNRFGFHNRDLQALMIKMNANNVPKIDRHVLIDDNMYGYFYDTLGDTNAKDFSRYADAENGIVGKLHGFHIMTRSSVLAATNADAIKALGSVVTTTDCLGSIAWQKNTVAFAIGDKMLFQRLNDPLYYGDVNSLLVMAGGRVRRADGLGVYNIIQGTP